MQHVACVRPPCCDVLRHVLVLSVKFENGQIGANNTQHVAKWWPNARNMLRPTMLRYVALTCCDRLAGALADHSN